MPKIFTMPLEADKEYKINANTNAIGITLINDSGSAGGISVTGKAKVYINDEVVESQPIVYGPGEMQSIGVDAPGVELIINTAGATTGKLLIVI